MRQVILAVLAMVAMLGLTGCAGQYLEVSEKAIERIPQDIGRFSAHLGVRTQEEKTKQRVADAKKAEAEAEKTKAANIAVNLDTTEKLLAYSLAETNKVLGKAIEALARRDGGNEFGLATTPTPKGVIAETLDSAGNAIAKVADTPAALAGAVGVAAVKIAKAGIKEAGDDTQTGDNSPVTVTKTTTTNTTKSTNTGESGSATGSTGNPTTSEFILPAEGEEETTETTTEVAPATLTP